jgi:hypothetical protein
VRKLTSIVRESYPFKCEEWERVKSIDKEKGKGEREEYLEGEL